MAALLPAADLSWMRTEQERAQNGTAVISRATLAADNYGGQTETWAAIGTVTARLDPMAQRSDREMVSGGQIISKSRWFVTVPIGTDVLATDRVAMGGRTLEVTFVNNDQTYDTALRIECVAHNEETRL